jgi:hypothetical protein
MVDLMWSDPTFCHYLMSARSEMLEVELTYLLLEKRDQEVDGQHGVLHDVVFGHVDVTDSDTET